MRTKKECDQCRTFPSYTSLTTGIKGFPFYYHFSSVSDLLIIGGVYVFLDGTDLLKISKRENTERLKVNIT